MREGSTDPTDGEPEPAEATTPERDPTLGNVDDVAPADVKQPDLVLNKLRDMLRDERTASELAEESGMSLDELNQFVRKFEKAPDAEPGQARTLETDGAPGQDLDLDPNRELTGPLPKSVVSSRSQRGPNSVPQDEAGGNTQGVRTIVPPEYLSRFEAYRKGHSGNTAPAPPATPPARPGGSGR